MTVAFRAVSGGPLPPGGEVVSLDALETLAREVWATLPDHAVLWLSGDLGTGKTTFVQALTRAAGAERATSPTFTLVQEYGSPAGSICHVDCYRLRAPAEAADLDLDELCRTARVVIIEWPERAGRYAPPPTMHLEFFYGPGPDEREIVRAG